MRAERLFVGGERPRASATSKPGTARRKHAEARSMAAGRGRVRGETYT